MRLRIDIDKIGRLEGAARDEAIDHLRRLQQVFRDNPLQGYNPWSKQRSFHAADTKLRIITGGNRSGKTTVGVLDDIIQVTPRELVPERFHKWKRYDCPCYVRIVNPSSKLQRTVIVPKLREWLPVALLRDGSFDRSYSNQDASVQLQCGCRIDLLSYEQELNKHGGAAMHRVHYDEEPPEDIREEGFMRIADFNGDEIFTMTPQEGLTWMYDDLILRADEIPDQIFHTTASMLDNPYLPQEARDRVLAMYADSPTAAARIYGEWVHFAGMVFPAWRDCEVDQTIEPGWLGSQDIYVGLDPGIRWTGLVWAAFDEVNAMHVFDSVKLEDATVTDVVRKIHEVNDKWGGIYPRYVIDPAGRSREHGSGKKVETLYADEGIYTEHGNNDREYGVSEIRRRIANGMLTVYAGNDQLHKEAVNYRILERDDGKFDVIKEKDHIVDALRYVAGVRPFTPDLSRPVKPDPYRIGVASPPPKREFVSSQGRFA